MLLVEFVQIYALFERTKRTKNLRWEDQNGFLGPGPPRPLTLAPPRRKKPCSVHPWYGYNLCRKEIYVIWFVFRKIWVSSCNVVLWKLFAQSR